MAKFEQILWERFRNILKCRQYKKKMINFGNAASSHSGLIPLKTVYKKRGELHWAIASKKNFINLHSAAFVTVFGRNLVLAYKFRIFKKNRSSKIALASVLSSSSFIG